MGTEFYTLPELLERANALRLRIPELADTPAFTGRTVYYYVQQNLLPRRAGRRGPGTRYPADFLYRLLFIRRLQKERALSLANIRQALEEVAPATIRAVALGEEPLEVVDTGELDSREIEARRARHRESIWLDRAGRRRDGPSVVLDKSSEGYGSGGAARDDDLEAAVEPKAFPLAPDDLQVSYSRRLVPQSMKKAVSETGEATPHKRAIPLGPGARLVLDRTPSRRQVRRLRNLAPLVQDILEDPGEPGEEEGG